MISEKRLTDSLVLGDKIAHLFTVTEDVYRKFQECSQDRNPLHTDENFAKMRGFTGRVMYGNILNVFISYIVGECLPEKDVIIHSQEIHYHKPVYLGDTLNFEAIVNEVHENLNVVLLKYRYCNQAGELVARGKIQVGGGTVL